MQVATSIVDQSQETLGLSGVLRRFKRGESVAETGVTLGMIKNTYTHAIEFSSVTGVCKA